MRAPHLYPDMLTAATFGVLITSMPVFAGPVFLGLGDLPGGTYFSRANAVSADGSTVVGASWSGSGLEAFRWTLDTGMVGLGDLPGGGFRSEAFVVSADGSVVIGDGRPGSIDANEAFRWQGGTMIGLGSFPPGTFNTFSAAVSADGNVIVGGGGSADGFQAFRWTPNSGLVGLGDLVGGPFQSDARDVSADGSLVVGNSMSAPLPSDGEAFRWTGAEGMVGLGFLSGGGNSSSAQAVSGDGSVIVGGSDSAIGSRAFRWTEETGMAAIGEFIPLGLSHDGSLIVGELFPFSRAVLWDGVHGLRDLRALLEIDYGLDLTGWELGSARDISADGTVIVGLGVNAFGDPEAWVAVIPEPSTLVLLLPFAWLLPRRVRSSWTQTPHPTR